MDIFLFNNVKLQQIKEVTITIKRNQCNMSENFLSSEKLRFKVAKN